MNIIQEAFNEREHALDERERKINTTGRNLICVAKALEELLEEAYYGKKIS